nr:SLAM family member 7-like [Misgurnus anguillicaudatus]
MALWQLLTYLLLTYSTGSRAEDTVFVITGASVQLNIQTDKLPDDFDEIFWRNEKSDIIVKYYNAFKSVKYYDDNKDRVDFNTESFSLTLKNMKKKDSGVYKAITSEKSETLIVEHKVSVIDAVEAPVLTVNSGWSSTGLCNFTCNTNIIAINSVINNSSSCSEEVTSSGVYHLSLRCINDSIICNHSNPVSWKNDTKTIEPICIVRQDKRTAPEISSHLHWLIPIICISTLGLFGTVVGLCFYKNKKGT